MANELSVQQAVALWARYDVAMADHRAAVEAQRLEGCCPSAAAPAGMLYSPIDGDYFPAPKPPTPPTCPRPVVMHRAAVRFTDEGWT